MKIERQEKWRIWNENISNKKIDFNLESKNSLKFIEQGSQAPDPKQGPKRPGNMRKILKILRL